ncbi:tetratricopeptide repeat protein [Flavobacterium olei]|uniref:tetratricopeptide repeat protein n=1 Tax=Flavobacterium olei TaxID=1886782 RepID=UPI00321B0372
MENLSFYENQFIKADSLISEGNSADAKELLEELLSQYPDFGKAHNHLGWIYYNKLSDYEKGVYHYKLAMKFDPKYPAPYLNYTYLLIDLGRYAEAKEHIRATMANLENADNSSYNSELGRMAEYEGQYAAAFTYYKEARKNALNPNFIDNMNANMKRVKDKMSIFEKLKLKLK